MPHTPAPWQLAKSEESKLIKVLNKYGTRIAGITPMENDEANARLIAAAPELLEALKALVARMEENQPAKAKPRDDMHKVYARAVFYRDLQAAREAIAKAESND